MARKILFYTNAFGGGGAEIVFARLAQALAAAGHEVVFAADHEGPTPVEDRPGLRHVCLGGGHAASASALARLLHDERPDASFSALGVHNLKHLAAAVRAGRRHHCVLGYHGFATAEPKPLSRLSYWLSPATTRLAARTICVSDALKADIVGRWHADLERTLRIHNPVAQPLGAREPDLDSGRLILACGRLVPIKRFDDLIRAFEALRAADTRLVILGEGPERPALERLVRDSDLGHRISLAGHVADPSDWYRRASCLVITSASESFGLTAAEALSYGVPVVATDCGGPPEVVRDPGCGRIVPIGDIPALAAAIDDVLASPGPDAPRLQRAQDFSLEAISAAYADLADALADGQRMA